MAIFPHYAADMTGRRLKNNSRMLVVHHWSESGVLQGGTVWEGDYYVTVTGRYRIGSGSYAEFEISEIPRSSIQIDTSNPTEEWRQVSIQATGNAQSIINEIIANNKRIFENNLFAARFRHYLTIEDAKLVQGLQYRLERRNQQLQDEYFIQSYQTVSVPGFDQFQTELKSLMAANIGAVPLVPILALVGKVVIAASVVTVAYWAYKAFYNESKDDVKFSDDLTKKIKDKLTAEEWSQLERETGGMVTKARMNEKLKSFGNVTTFIIIAAIGFVALPLLSKAQNKLNS